MADRARRKELQAQYKQAQPEAGVYRIVNDRNDKILLGSTPNIASVRNKLVFLQTTHTTGLLDHRLREDIRAFGIDAFSLEVLEIMDIEPTMTREEIGRDLVTLEELWRERFDPALLY